MLIFDHASAKAACVAHGKQAESKRIANNTYVEARYPYSMGNPSYAIRLHKTDIVTYHPDGRIVLSTGGWRTSVTKSRMNDNLPSSIRVYSDKGVWRVTASPATIVLDGHAMDISYLFVDGIELEKVPGKSYGYHAIQGTALTGAQEDQLLEAKRRLQRIVRGYLQGLPAKVSEWQKQMNLTGTVDVRGDCLYCQGIVTDTSGQRVEDSGHLWSHLEEGYIPATLVMRAYQAAIPADPAKFLSRHIQMGLVTYIHKNLRRYLLDRLDPTNAVRPQREDAYPQHYVDWAKAALAYPDDFGYHGTDETLYKASAPTWTRTRDSESLELANFDAVETLLIEAFPDLWSSNDSYDEEKGYPQIYIMRSGHWAVGWIEQIVIPVLLDPALPLSADNLHPAWITMCKLKEQTDLYPYLEGVEEAAAEMDTTAEMEDLERTLVYLADEYGRERSALPEATDVHWKIQELDDEYFWSQEQVRKALQALGEDAAYEIGTIGLTIDDQMELFEEE